MCHVYGVLPPFFNAKIKSWKGVYILGRELIKKISQMLEIGEMDAVLLIERCIWSGKISDLLLLTGMESD